MSIGLYFHIPFCLQQCSYCDFTTLADNPSLHQGYVENLVKEIETRSSTCPSKELNSIYFGGGTPSLLSVGQLEYLLQSLRENGFLFSDETETTLEINPGTIDQVKLDELMAIGINRFSVGAQTFNDKILAKIGRLHSAKDTLDTLKLLNDKVCNYSFDLLFALPGQTEDDLNNDLNLIEDFLPPHISSYYLTIPKNHKLQQERPEEELELKFFDIIEDRLTLLGYDHYELSNYSRNGNSSVHNLNAWRGGEYWGIGLSAHSHLIVEDLKIRFWNPNTLKAWESYLDTNHSLTSFPPHLSETLRPTDVFNDLVHTGLRISSGFSLEHIAALDQSKQNQFLLDLKHLKQQGLVTVDQNFLKTTKTGRRLLNLVLEKLFILQ